MDQQHCRAPTSARQALGGRAVGPFGQFVLAAILVRQNRLDEARRTLEDGLRVRPDMDRTRLHQVFDFIPETYLSDHFLSDLQQAGLPG